MIEDKEEGNVGLEDAVQALFEAGAKKDWKGAAEAFADAQSLSDDDSSEEAEGDDGKEGEGGKGKPLAALIFGSKK